MDDFISYVLLTSGKFIVHQNIFKGHQKN